jgi:hypothetical protein
MADQKRWRIFGALDHDIERNPVEPDFRHVSPLPLRWRRQRNLSA